MRGETVTVIRRVEVGRDPGNSPIYADEEEPVADVLVAPGPRTDLAESARPEGVEVRFTLHFPKTFTGELRGAAISVRGEEPLRVIGSPRPYTRGNCPTRWHMPVEVGRADG